MKTDITNKTTSIEIESTVQLLAISHDGKYQKVIHESFEISDCQAAKHNIDKTLYPDDEYQIRIAVVSTIKEITQTVGVCFIDSHS